MTSFPLTPDRYCAIPPSPSPSRTHPRGFCGGGVPGFPPPWRILAMAALVRSKNAFGFLRRRRRTHRVATARQFSRHDHLGVLTGTGGEAPRAWERLERPWFRHGVGRTFRNVRPHFCYSEKLMATKNNCYCQNCRNNMHLLMSFWTNLRVPDTPVHFVWALGHHFRAIFEFSDRVV